MAKELPFFKFEPNQWENGNIQICNREEKGLFIDLCSMYWSRLGNLPFKLAVQKLCGGNATAFDPLIREDIFALKNDMVCINFLDEQLNEFKETSTQNSKNAKSRWEGNAYKIKDTSDRNAIASKSQSEINAIREDKKREEKRREEKNKILMSELFSSDVSNPKNLIIKFEIPEKEKQPAKIAYQFWQLIKSNLERNRISIVKHEKAIYKNWVPPIRLIIENKEATIDQLREIHSFLKTDSFWLKVIQSTEKLREKTQQLLLTIKAQENGQSTENKRANKKSARDQRKEEIPKSHFSTPSDQNP